MTYPARRRLERFPLPLLACGLAAALALGALAPAAAEHSAPAERTTVHLVTLTGPGVAGYRGPLTRPTFRELLIETQDDVLGQLDRPDVLYRWTDALNGFAAELSPAEVDLLRADERVAVLEENAIRPLASTPTSPTPLTLGSLPSRGGAGAVLGLVDTGLTFGSSVFAPTPALGRPPRDFHAACAAPDRSATDYCNGKVVAARWFVHGFGADNLRSSSSLSPVDDHGHGTQMASIAAGNADVSVEVPGQSMATYGGVAPQARIAVYKACWTAPDPADDGCATADLVTAIDRATRDGVDVLNLSVGGPAEVDSVERALLGAAERGIVVVGAAGNQGSDGFAAHPSPWVTTVGGVTGEEFRGRVELPGRGALPGAMVAGRAIGPARLVVAGDVPAPGASPVAARQCRPRSLDAARTRGAIVLCERGGLARVAKSGTVADADGVGMVLVNTRPGSVEVDLHRVPTVHLTVRHAPTLARWSERHPRGKVTLTPLGTWNPPPEVTRWSSGGDPSAPIVKPDVVAPATGLLGAVPPAVRGSRWDFVAGTSAAAAWTSGLALRLTARHDWTADEVRSALVTTAGPVAGNPSALRAGAGRPRPAEVERPVLAYRTEPGDYRSWLEGSLRTTRLNTPSVQLAAHDTAAVRTVTNVGARAATFTGDVSGFEDHQMAVTPSVLRLAPGQSATFRVRVSGDHHASPADDGWVTWRRSDGATARIRVVLTR